MTSPSGHLSDTPIDSEIDDEALALALSSSCREVMVGFSNLDPRLPIMPFGGQPPWRD